LKSSHLTEAVAAACGFNTHAALLTAIRQGNPDDPEYVLLDESSFASRLSDFAESPIIRGASFDLLSFSAESKAVNTMSRGQKGSFTSTRQRAWRNAMVAVINEGIARRLFTIRPGDNRWPGAANDQSARVAGHRFEFVIEGIPAVGHVHDAGYDELAISVAFWPAAEGARFIGAMNAGFWAGDVWAPGWLERREGAWLQVGSHAAGRTSFRARRNKLARISDLTVHPRGYADRGSFAL
jgi:hypothetical protein